MLISYPIAKELVVTIICVKLKLNNQTKNIEMLTEGNRHSKRKQEVMFLTRLQKHDNHMHQPALVVVIGAAIVGAVVGVSISVSVCACTT